MDEKRIIDEKLSNTNPIDLNPMIITDLNLRIVGVNRNWINMCKFSHEEAFGNTPKILQGPLTNIEVARSFASTLCSGLSSSASLINYKKNGNIFMNHIYGWSMGDLFVAETYKNEELYEPLKNTLLLQVFL